MRRRNYVLSLAFIIVIIILTFIIYSHHKSSMKAHYTIAQNVKIIAVKLTNWTDKIRAIGTVRAQNGAVISSSLSGIITKINFQSGEKIKKGDLLVVLQNNDLQAAAKQDKLKYQLAKEQYLRYKKIYSLAKAVAQFDIQKLKSSMEQTKAQLDRDQALLDKTYIAAPFSGNLGIRKVDLGQFVSPGQEIVSLQDLSVLYVDFTLPEKDIYAAKVGSKVEITVDGPENNQLIGVITAISSQLDENTRNLLIRAQITSSLAGLLPGMYVKVFVLLPEKKAALLIPQSAVVYNPYGTYVYVFNNGHAIEHRVELSDRVGEDIIVESGLKIGDEVIYMGQQNLYNGATVKIEG